MGIVFLTTTDIVCRYFFNHPVTGTYDLVGLMGAVVASFSMPYTLLEKGHVSVEILMQRLSRTKQLIIDTVMHFVSILLFLALTWQCLLLAQDMAAAGEVTPTLLLPFYPIVYCMAICFCVLCFAIFVNLLNVWSKGVKK
jgi:TRAP-type C4-dicarboxylate transport system permease small subunit